MALFEQVSKDIREAMKAHDKVRLETLRNIKKFFLEAKTAPGANDTLEDDAAMKILQKLAKQGEESAEVYQKAGRIELANDMGKVMGLASKQMAGQADGKTISTIVRQLLA